MTDAAFNLSGVDSRGGERQRFLFRRHMAGELIPFGKYKGQPVEILIADDDYRDWLVAQPWFRSRFGNVYQTVINYGGPPQETPEHNQMQATFLDDEKCFRLGLLLAGDSFSEEAARRKAFKSTHNRFGNSLTVGDLCKEFRDYLKFEYSPPTIDGRQFEAGGWDVVYTIDPSICCISVTSLPPCTCGPCDHGKCEPDSECRGGTKWQYGYCKHQKHDERLCEDGKRIKIEPHYHCVDCVWADDCKNSWLAGIVRYTPTGQAIRVDESRQFQPRAITVNVECKPDLGDDFPAVLRQVTQYKSEGRRCVVVRRYSFNQVTWEQVTAIFTASNITLLLEDELMV